MAQQEWEDLRIKDGEKYSKEYSKFMYNKKNRCNCKECPSNRGVNSWNDQLPCGQYNCWVTCHTSH